ncbi:uncharacterized protein Dmoj_GI21370 [Drosophila mojavensis]|uniref:Uncharacterized protein n=1 Tax=Drosophila mojavensis TaxID=7230 RepID=B4KG47_DROMO|nr:uncharacterized protein Dmoj_GI21370 [Drosophila mojavensis]
MQQSYDATAAQSYALDPHSVVTTSSTVSLLMKPTAVGLTYAEVLSGHASPRKQRVTPPSSSNNTTSDYEETTVNNSQMETSSSTSTIDQQVPSISTNPNSQFIEMERSQQRMNTGKKLQPPRPERRARSPRRRREPQSAVQDRARSRSPIWVPGSTSYAEVLRGMELERLKAEELARQTAQPHTDLTIQDVVDASGAAGNIFVPRNKPEQHQQQMDQFIGEPSADLGYAQPQVEQKQISNYEVPMTAEEIAATYLQPDLQLYQTMYENVADSGQWSYVAGSSGEPQQQAVPQNYYDQMMQMQYPIQYQPVAGPPTTTQYQLLTGYYQPVAQTETYPTVYTTEPSQIYYAQQPQVYTQEYTQQQQQQQQPQQTEISTDVPVYQPEIVNQAYLLEPYRPEVNQATTSTTGNSVLDRVVTTLASMVQQSAEPLTTSTQQIQATVVTPQAAQEQVPAPQPVFIEEHVQMLRPVEPQEFEMDEPRPDITFGQFDVDAIETIPIEVPQSQPQQQAQPQSQQDITKTTFVEETIISQPIQPTVIARNKDTDIVVVRPEVQQPSKNVYQQQDPSTGSTYAEVLFGQQHRSAHPVFQPSSQQQQIPVRVAAPMSQIRNAEHTTTTTTITTKYTTSNTATSKGHQGRWAEKSDDNVEGRIARPKRQRHEQQPEPLPIKVSNRKEPKASKKHKSPETNGASHSHVESAPKVVFVEELHKPEPKPRKSKKSKHPTEESTDKKIVESPQEEKQTVETTVNTKKTTKQTRDSSRGETIEHTKMDKKKPTIVVETTKVTSRTVEPIVKVAKQETVVVEEPTIEAVTAPSRKDKKKAKAEKVEAASVTKKQVKEVIKPTEIESTATSNSNEKKTTVVETTISTVSAKQSEPLEEIIEPAENIVDVAPTVVPTSPVSTPTKKDKKKKTTVVVTTTTTNSEKQIQPIEGVIKPAEIAVVASTSDPKPTIPTATDNDKETTVVENTTTETSEKVVEPIADVIESVKAVPTAEPIPAVEAPIKTTESIDVVEPAYEPTSAVSVETTTVTESIVEPTVEVIKQTEIAPVVEITNIKIHPVIEATTEKIIEKLIEPAPESNQVKKNEELDKPVPKPETPKSVEPVVESVYISSEVSDPTTVSSIDMNETLLESEPVVTTSTNTISTESGTTTITTRTITKHITKRIVKRIIDGREEIVEEDVIDDLPEENISVEQFDLPSVDTTSSVPGSIIVPGLSSAQDTTVVQGGSITKTTITKTKRILKRITADGEEIVEEVYEDEPEVERDITLLPTTVITSRNDSALEQPIGSHEAIIDAAQLAVDEIVVKAEQVVEPQPQKPPRKDKKELDTVIVAETIKMAEVEPEQKPQKPSRKDKKKQKKSESEEVKLKAATPILQNVSEISEPQPQLETTEPLNTTSAITTDEKQIQSSDGSAIIDDDSLIKTTVIRTTKIVKKINQQENQEMSTSIHSDVTSLDSYEFAEEAAEEPKVEKSEMSSREISGEGVVKTTKTTTIRTIKSAKAEPDKELVTEAIRDEESTPEAQSTVDVLPTEDGSVLKTTIVRTTKIIKKITQDSDTISDHSSNSEPSLETVETIIQDAPIVAESVTTESNSEGITKTITTRTTKAVLESTDEPAVVEPKQIKELLLPTPPSTEVPESGNIKSTTLDFIASEKQSAEPVPEKETRKSKKQEIHIEVANKPAADIQVATQELVAPVEEEPKQAIDITRETVAEPNDVNINNDVVKTTITRTTKIVKKVSQNVDKQSVSEIQESQTPEEPTPVAVEPTNDEAGGVTKTTTVRTTKIVKKLNEDGETTTESSTISEPITVRETSPTISELPSEASTTSSQIDGAIIKTTTIRTMRITKRITNDGRIVLTESDTPSDVIVTSSIEMPDHRSTSPIVSSRLESAPVVTSSTESKLPNVGVNIELGIRDTAGKSGVKVVGIETTELPTVNTEYTSTNGAVNESARIATTTTTTTKNTILTTTRQRSFETEDGTNVLFVGEGIDGAYPPGTVQKISLITHEEKLKTPIVKMHLDFPEVSLRVTETVTENRESLQRTADSSESSIVEFTEAQPEVVESVDVTITDLLKQQNDEEIPKIESIEQVDMPKVVEKNSEPPSDLSPEEQKLFEDIQKKLSKKDKKKRPAIPEEFIKQETIQVLVEESKADNVLVDLVQNLSQDISLISIAKTIEHAKADIIYRERMQATPESPLNIQVETQVDIPCEIQLLPDPTNIANQVVPAKPSALTAEAFVVNTAPEEVDLKLLESKSETTDTIVKDVTESVTLKQPEAVIPEQKPEKPQKVEVKVQEIPVEKSTRIEPVETLLPEDINTIVTGTTTTTTVTETVNESTLLEEPIAKEIPVDKAPVAESVTSTTTPVNEPEKMVESSDSVDTKTTVTVTSTTTVTEIVSESTLPEEPKTVEAEKKPEEPKRPAYAGLPVDETTSTWMDVLDEPMTFSDDEEEPTTTTTTTVVEPEKIVESSDSENTKTTVTVTTTTVTETVSESTPLEEPKTVEAEMKPEEPKKPAYAGLPVDETSSTWMDVLDEPMTFSDDEEEPEKEVPVEKESVPEQATITTVIEPEKNIESSVSKDTKTTVTVTSTTTVTDTVSESTLTEEPKMVETEKKPEEPKKPAYAGLPVDETTSTWMDVLDEPMTFSDDEEEPEKEVPVEKESVPEQATITTVIEPEKIIESSVSKDTKTTVTVTSTTTVTDTVSESTLTEEPKMMEAETKPEEPKKPAYAGLPVDETTSTWMDVLDEPMTFSDDEEESEKEVPVEKAPIAETITTTTTTTVIEPEKIVESSASKDSNTTVTVTSTTTVTEIVSESTLPEEPKTVAIERKPEEPKKKAYAGLPVDETTSTWMEVLDEPMTFSDDEEEPTTTETTTTVIEPKKINESSASKDSNTTVTVTSTTTETETVSEFTLPEEPKTVEVEKKPENSTKKKENKEKPTIKRSVENLPVTESISTSITTTVSEPEKVLKSPVSKDINTTKPPAESRVQEHDSDSENSPAYSNLTLEGPIDTWSSVLEESSPNSGSAVFISTLSADAPEFTPSYLRHTYADQTHTFLANERVYNEFIPRSRVDQQMPLSKKPKKVKPAKKARKPAEDPPQEVPIDTPVSSAFVLDSDITTEPSVWENNRDGKSYADVLFNAGDSSKLQSSEKPVTAQEQKLEIVESLPRIDKPKEQKKKAKQEKQMPVEHIQENLSTDSSKPVTTSSKEPSSDEREAAKPSELTWSALVQRPGEWTDTTVVKNKVLNSETIIDDKKLKKEEKSERKTTKTKKSKKSKKPVQEQVSTTSEDEKQESEAPVLTTHTKKISEAEYVSKPIEIEEPEQTREPESSGFSWASLVKRPGEWVDTTVTHIKSAITPSTENVEPDQQERDKPRKVRPQKKERTIPKKEQVPKKEKIISEPIVKEVIPTETDSEKQITDEKPIVSTSGAFSWAALLKKPGEFVDDIASRKKPTAVPKEEYKPEPRTRKERISKKGEKTDAEGKKTIDPKSKKLEPNVSSTSDSDVIETSLPSIPDNGVTTWAKIASQIDKMTDLPPKEKMDDKQKTTEFVKHVRTDRNEKKKPRERIPTQDTRTSSWASVTSQKTTDFIETEKAKKPEKVSLQPQPIYEMDIDIDHHATTHKSWADMIDDGSEDIVIEHKPWRELVEDEVEIPLLPENGDEANINKIIDTIQDMKSEATVAGDSKSTKETETKSVTVKAVPVAEPIATSIITTTVIEPEKIVEPSASKDSNTTVTVTSTTTVTEIVSESALPEEPKTVEAEKKPEEPKKPAYAGLPVDETTSTWMDVLDEPMTFSDDEEEPTSTTTTTTVIEPEKIVESSASKDSNTTVTVTSTTTVTEIVSESALPEEPKTVETEKKPEEPKKPAYAGLPVDETTSTWMDVLDEPMTFSDDEEESTTTTTTTTVIEPETIVESSASKDSNTTVTVTSTTTVTEIVSESTLPEEPKTVEAEKKPEEPKKPAYAGLPVDETTSTWMDVLDEPMTFSDDEEEPTTTTTTTTVIEPEKIVESTVSENTKTTVTVTTTVTETVSESTPLEEPKTVEAEKKPEEPKKPAYAGLPVDETTSTWMDVLDEPMTFSDDEEEPEKEVPVEKESVPEQATITTVIEPEKIIESLVSEDTKTTVTVTSTTTVTEIVSESILPEEPKTVEAAKNPEEPKKPAYAGLPVDETTSTWMDVLDEPMTFSDDEEESTTTTTTTTVIEPEKIVEPSASKDSNTTVTVTSTTTVTETVGEPTLPEEPKTVVTEKKPEEPTKPEYETSSPTSVTETQLESIVPEEPPTLQNAQQEQTIMQSQQIADLPSQAQSWSSIVSKTIATTSLDTQIACEPISSTPDVENIACKKENIAAPVDDKPKKQKSKKEKKMKIQSEQDVEKSISEEEMEVIAPKRVENIVGPEVPNQSWSSIVSQAVEDSPAITEPVRAESAQTRHFVQDFIHKEQSFSTF